MEKTNWFPKELDLGMKVTAVCMGREVGNYIVTTVFHNKVIMEVEEDPDSRNVIAERAVGDNGRVNIIGGALPIQATDYFVKPYTDNKATAEFNHLNIYLNQLTDQIERVAEAVQTTRDPEEHERLQNQLRELESQRNSVQDSIRNFIQRIIGDKR